MPNDARNSLAELVARLAEQEADIRLGGGRSAIDRQHKKKRLTARERIEKLLDPETTLFELGLWAGWGMYNQYGGAPAAGVITGIGTICGRRHMIIANDATVKAGAFFPATAKKVLRAQRIAAQNRLPLDLSGRLGRHFFAAARGCLSRRGRLRPDLPQQRRHFRDGFAADRRHHGQLRGGGRIFAGPVR